MKCWGLRVGFGCLGVVLCALPISAQTPKRYIAEYTDVAPIIDGMETSPEEWMEAQAGGDQWARLTSHAEDPNSNQFSALWDDSGFYLRHQANYGGWSQSGMSNWNPNVENINFFFDPNTDGEPNENTGVFESSIDGYQLAFNQPLGESEINPTTATAGLYSEAHVNALFGNHGAPFSGFAGLVMKQVTNAEEATSFTEIFIPWNNFDATNPDVGIPPETGLYHPEAPEEGDEWYFTVARYQTDGVLTSWESPLGASFMAARPHGILQFSPRPDSNPCDVNGDSLCDAIDIDVLSQAILEGDTNPIFDRDGNGAVDGADRKHYIEVDLFTWIGDSNLDGQFGSQDLVDVFVAGVYEDDIDSNAGWAAGDWSGDLNFTSQDLVDAFVSGGYELGPRSPMAATAAVPEPSSFVLILMGCLAAIQWRRMPKVPTVG